MPEIALSINKIYRSKYLYYTCYYFITAVLFISGISKIIDPQPLLTTLDLINFLPDEIRIAIATVLPMVELSLAVLLIGKIKVKLTLLLTLGLFFAFIAFSVYGTVAVFNADCGCFGNFIKSEFGFSMILRNSIFALFTLYIFINTSSIEKS